MTTVAKPLARMQQLLERLQTSRGCPVFLVAATGDNLERVIL